MLWMNAPGSLTVQLPDAKSSSATDWFVFVSDVSSVMPDTLVADSAVSVMVTLPVWSLP